MFFFVKQKTAYEMRISDWSSDVCSSDLEECGAIECDELGDHAREAGLVLDTCGELVAVGLGRLDEVFLVQRLVRAGVARFKQQTLPLLDHDVAVVVPHDQPDRQLVRRRRFQLTRSEERSVGIEFDSTCRPRGASHLSTKKIK